MRNLILFENETRTNLLPFTYTRPCCEIRLGILNIREKWEKAMNGSGSFITQDYLTDLYDISLSDKNYLINGAVLPTPEVVNQILQLGVGEALVNNDELIAALLDLDQFNRLVDDDIEVFSSYDLSESQSFIKVNNLWNLFTLLDWSIRWDFDKITEGRTSEPLPKSNTLIGSPSWLFIEKGALVEGATINTSAGPVYIGKNATVMEGSNIRGPFALGEKGTVKMGAKIYGPTAAGPYSTLGGEIKNVLMLEHASKGHEGYIGNSVIGAWCNLGADTNCSNLKNNWTEVKIWDFEKRALLPSGQLKAGLFLGDYSMTSINSMFNTGTVVGICCNIFGSGFPEKFIPSFTWGGTNGSQTYLIDKALAAIERMKNIHKQSFTVEERIMLLKVFEESARYRTWEKKSDTMSYLKAARDN